MPTPQVAMLMPDLRGRSVRDVARTCAQLGLHDEAKGEGKVLRQSPSAGSESNSGPGYFTSISAEPSKESAVRTLGVAQMTPRTCVDEETSENDVRYGIDDCRKRLRSHRATLRAQHLSPTDVSTAQRFGAPWELCRTVDGFHEPGVAIEIG